MIHNYFQGFEGALKASEKYLVRSEKTNVINRLRIHYPTRSQFELLIDPIIRVTLKSYHKKKIYSVYLSNSIDTILWIKCECSRALTGLCGHGAAACLALIGEYREFVNSNNSVEIADYLSNFDGRI